MSQAETGHNFELKAILRDVSLLSLLRASDNSCRQSSTLVRKNERGNLLVSFLTENGSCSITGFIRGRFPLCFKLKPESRSYYNLMRFLHSELENEALREETIPKQGASPQDERIRALIAHLEDKLDSDASHLRSEKPPSDGETEFYQSDFELGGSFLYTPQLLRKLDKKIEVLAEKSAACFTLPAFARQTAAPVKKFSFYNGTAQKPILISGFLSLEIDETASDASSAAEPGAAAAPAGKQASHVEPFGFSEARHLLRLNLGKFETLSAAISTLERSGFTGSIPQLLYELTRNNKKKRAYISRCLRTARMELVSRVHGDRQEAAQKVLNALENIGIGEVVLISPEGPHAIAGGLAQVIVGLMRSLTRRGIPVTLISPLYEEWFGNITPVRP